MGDRGQVKIVDTGVYLYTHSGATELVSRVQEALAKRLRWDDEEYLTRIIFDTMKNGQVGELGYGIGTILHSDVWLLVVVNCQTKMVEVVRHGETIWKLSFEEFLSYKGVLHE